MFDGEGSGTKNSGGYVANKGSKLRYLWVCLYLTYCKLKDLSIAHYKRTTLELFILQLVFLYLIYIGLPYLQPRIQDIYNLDLPYSAQLRFMLLNMGVMAPTVTNLHALSDDNVVFAMDLVNAEDSVHSVLQSMEYLACSFKSAHVIVFVSAHSRDSTRDIINKWRAIPPDCNAIHRRALSTSSGLKSNFHTDLSLISLPSNYTQLDDARSSDAQSARRVFWEKGNVSVIAITPSKELEEVQRMMETQRSNPDSKIDIGAFRQCSTRNLIIAQALQIYDTQLKHENNGNAYLFMIGTHNFDVQSVATQFKIAWTSGYDVVCANGVRYNGWYFDSFPTVLADNTWFIGMDRYKTTRIVHSKQFVDSNSCNGDVVAYNLKLIAETKCKYLPHKQAEEQIKSLQAFTDKYNPKTLSVHMPFNYCLKERGDAKIAIASNAYSFLGINKFRWTQLDERL